MAKFEVVNRFKDHPELLPIRATKSSAGYDFIVAEDIVVEPMTCLLSYLLGYDPGEKGFTLEKIALATKTLEIRPTLVSTGVKCQLAENQYLEVSVRSSTPLKHWLFMANGIGIIDADYYNNLDNEGEIFVPLINVTPYPIALKKGDKIAQGIIKHYDITEDDEPQGDRTGGFGSTTNK